MDERQTTVRLEPEIRARLDRYCRDERRTMNAAINALLDAALPPPAETTAPDGEPR